jgi:cystathionine gamma-synthase
VWEELHWWQNATGAVPGPFDCWLAHRGLRTLPVRVRRASANAQAVAEALAQAPGVTAVRYPGLASDPGHALAAAQMADGFGAVVSFELATPELARAVAEGTHVFRLAVSLGAVESLIEYPRTMTHSALRDTPEAAPAGLVRLAVGLEDPADLIADLAGAIGRAVAAGR